MSTDTYRATYSTFYGLDASALYVFTPPTLDRVPPVLPDTRGLQFALWRHYAPTPQGLNLYKYADGTYVLDRDPEHSTVELAGETAPVLTYYGGHLYSVDASEAAALIDAGYGDYLETPAGLSSGYLSTYSDGY